MGIHDVSDSSIGIQNRLEKYLYLIMVTTFNIENA